MPRALFLLIVLFSAIYCCAQNNNGTFHIKGKILNTKKSKITVAYGYETYDTTLSPEKTFEIKGNTPDNHLLIINTELTAGEIIWITGGEINVTLAEFQHPDDPDKTYFSVIDVSGSPETIAYQRFYDLWFNLALKYTHIPLPLSRLDSGRVHIYPEIKKYVTAHPSSHLSAYLPTLYDLRDEHKKELIRLLDKKTNAQAIAEMEEKIKKNDLTRPGTLVPNWKQTKIDGTPFSLHSVKARYILLQFWNDKSGDCRRLNKELVNLYKKYHPLGFEIVSIYIEINKKEWTQAVKEDGITWINISDLKGWQSKMFAAYDLDRIPYNILINSKYQIVASGMELLLLEWQLKELFPIKN